MELAILFGTFGIGNIFFGHFELHTPRWRRLLKLALFAGMTLLVYSVWGRPWSLVWWWPLLLVVVYVHAVWLPSKGIDGLTAEPREKYYRLRGWTKHLKP